jgi:hypothetical protein
MTSPETLGYATNEQFKAALATLGISHRKAARLFDQALRTVVGHANSWDLVPKRSVIILALMLEYKLTPDKVEKLLKKHFPKG